MPDDTLLITISSPSGTGKTTLCQRLLEDVPTLRFSVSTTTRRPRGQEVDGRDYHFVTDEQFQAMIDAGEFVEWAHVHGHSYGTTHGEVSRHRAAGCGVLFDVDYRGSAQIKAGYPEAITVFLLPPSMEELERRIRGRGLDDEDQVTLRLSNAREEVERYGQFDYIVVNDDLDSAYERLKAIYLAELCRGPRQVEAALRLLGS